MALALSRFAAAEERDSLDLVVVCRVRRSTALVQEELAFEAKDQLRVHSSVCLTLDHGSRVIEGVQVVEDRVQL